MNPNKRWAKRRQQYRPHSVRSRLNMCWCLCKYTYANVYWNRFYITLSAMFSLHFSAIAIFIKWTFKYRNGMNETKRKKRRGKIERMQKKTHTHTNDSKLEIVKQSNCILKIGANMMICIKILSNDNSDQYQSNILHRQEKKHSHRTR